jgi:hypothetical protein
MSVKPTGGAELAPDVLPSPQTQPSLSPLRSSRPAGPVLEYLQSAPDVECQ